MNKNFRKIKKNGGAAMLISVVFFLFISLSIIAGLVAPSIREFRNANVNLNSKKSYFLAESGSEDVIYRLLKNISVGDSESLTLDSNSVTTTVTTLSGNAKEISSLGDVSSYQRKTKVTLSTGVGVSFSYGVQSGSGGFIMDNNSVVNGSVYSNGHITGSGAITGTALSANSAALVADQANDSGTPSYNVIFGNANGTQDFAQSFQVSATGPVNKVDLYLKKVSTPSSLTVKIVSNSGSAPSTTTIASGSLSSSLISTNYGWVSVPFSTNPELTAGTTYWIVIDGSTNSSRYYLTGADDNGYAGGASKIGQYGGTWNNNSPTTLDGFFKLYLGGLTGLIDGITVGTGGVGNAYAHTVDNSTIAGTNYCQTGTGNNKSCNTSLPDPTQIAMPISDQNILDWKSEAEAGGTHSGNYILSDSSGSLGPKKITGNLTIENSADLTVTGTLWVQGNVLVSNNATVSLDPSYGTAEGVIVADGTITINNNANFTGSGSSGSYLMVLSTSTSTSAITLANNGGAVILYAANGTVNLGNNAGAKALNGKFIHLSNNVVITYDSGLVNSNFVNGPSGGWNIQNWEESE
jgi:hypothetical protein